MRCAAGAAVRATLAFVVLLASALPPTPAAAQTASNVVTSLTIFAGTPSGLWRSEDWGASWRRVEGGEIAATGAVRCILPGGAGVWMGTERGLFVSEDFGRTWKSTDLTVPVYAVLPSRYFGADPTVFVGTADGLLKSSDGGRTFAPTLVRGFPVTRIEWPGPALVLATANGVLVSPDGGATVRSGVGLPGGAVHAIALSSFFAADPVLFAGLDRGVYRSRDGGRTWTPSGLAGHAVRDLVWLGPFLYAATDSGLFRSDDAGEIWSALGEGLKGHRPRRLLFPLAPDSGAEAFLATDRGILRTADGGERWQPTGALDDSVLTVATFPPPQPALRKR